MTRLRHSFLAVVFILVSSAAYAQAPVHYTLTFPDYVHHVMHVDVTFPALPAGPLTIRMSRSSPGRYALHEFAKNVFDVRITGAGGRAVPVERPDLHRWVVANHGGEVRVQYNVFGQRVDGTYLAVDSRQAHINPPAALMWAVGLEKRPARVTFAQPPGESWTVATQLFATGDALSFTAPNLQYLLDSPIQFARQVVRAFTVAPAGGEGAQEIRLALHHAGTDQDADAYAGDLERIVKEQRAIFGELPAFDGGSYTFLATYLPGANGDGMEHRNSTVITSGGSIQANRIGLLGTASHEFFHAWNVERIRPRSLEPFDFADANPSGELWLAEGFTSYYGPLTLLRSGLNGFEVATRQWAGPVNAVTMAPGRSFRSAVEMSRLAPFVDAAVSIDPTNWPNTFLSYYTYGAALGLGLDLALRDLTDSRVSLDDYMRALWTKFGKTKAEAGYVATPYTLADARATLATVSGSAKFADEFFGRYVEGREVIDYKRLLARAGLVLKPRREAGWIGTLRTETADGGVRLQASPALGSPAYTAGLGEGDVILAVNGSPAAATADVDKAIGAVKASEKLTVRIKRNARELTLTIPVVADPQQEIVTIESTGGTLTPAQKTFRESWIGSRVR